MHGNATLEALNAADRLLGILKSLKSDVLGNVELQRRIQAICDFEHPRERKRPRATEEPKGEHCGPIDNFCETLGPDQRKKFINAVQAVQNATWTKGSPLFAGFAFQQADDELVTLLDWCKSRKTDVTREMRILTLLLEAYVHEEAEVKGTRTKDVYQALSERTSWSERVIKDKLRCGRWHMRVLESETLGLGALAILGDNHYSTGTALSADPRSIDQFVQYCLRIDGFEAKSHELAEYVHDGVQLCIQNLRFGQNPLTLSSDSQLQRILDRHEHLHGSGNEDEVAPETSQQIQISMRSEDINVEEQRSSSTTSRTHSQEFTNVSPIFSSDLMLIHSGEEGASDTCEIRARSNREIGDVVLRSGTRAAFDTKISHALPPVASLYHSRLWPQMTNRMWVADTAPSVLFAISGNISGLTHLFSQGLASPMDMSITRGFSLVRWALYGGMHNYRTVQFLLNQGATVDKESYEHVWDFAFRGKCNITEINELKCITLHPTDRYESTDWVEEQHFPLIHQIILGRDCSKALTDELRDNPAAVYSTDAMGRTALDWATCRAQLSNMTTLIQNDSPLNTIDLNGRSTVLHAVDSHNTDALRILLEAGANADLSVPNRSSPLIAACFGGLPEMVELLINQGAKVEPCNPEGRTALQVVAEQNTDAAAQCAKTLLDHGADPCCKSSSGSSSFEIAISHNSHAVLMLFTEQHDPSRCLDWPVLLPTIANCADATTMSILASPNLQQSRPAHWADGDGFTENYETMRSRADYNEALDEAFKELCRG